jgi:HAD superfamily hydrolase (TIGR01549 family)
VIKAVYFDLDDTLYDQLMPFQLALEASGLTKLARGGLSAEAIFKRIRFHSDRLWSIHVEGKLSLSELRIRRTTEAFAEIGLEITDEAADALQRNYELEQSRLSLREGVLTLFGQLKAKGIKLGLITNGPVQHQLNKVTALGLLEVIDKSEVHISDGMGIAKPDPEVFRHVQRLSGYLPEELVYVGDAWHNDIAPSSSAGWTPVWLNARKQEPSGERIPVDYLSCQFISEVYTKLILHEQSKTGCLL